MYKINLGKVKNSNDYEELIRMFLPTSEYELIDNGDEILADIVIQDERINGQGFVQNKDEIKKDLYNQLNKLTGKTLKWGTLTGVKPLKLYSNILREVTVSGDSKKSASDYAEKVRSKLKTEYLVDDKKIDLLEEINKVQKEILKAPQKNQVSVYIGIPFCPTKCTYCSFTSNQKDYQEIKRYLKALYKEIDYVSKEMKGNKLEAETIYIGGGTPTTLKREELKELLEKIKAQIPTMDGFEFTVEAGRPDTIDEDKLKVLSDNHVGRISINPQTMKSETLRIMGRDHNNDQIKNAFEQASKIKFKAINADIIAGLPGETPNDFRNTLSEVVDLNPNNITVHTLAIKKSSKMLEELENNAVVHMDGVAEQMVGDAEFFLKERGYRPYYIYRQKYMADNLENVGYAKPGTECIYNIRIMEEKQTIIAMGAGGSSKVYFPDEDRLERVMNVSNYEIYIDRIDEMIDRKRENLFGKF